VRPVLEEDEAIGGRETLRVLARALRYVGPFRARFAGKLGLTLLSLLPLLVIPWPVKIVIDHVIQAIPIGETPRPLPFFVRPFVDALQGASPLEILLAVCAVQLALAVVVGAFGTRESDRADAYLSGGHDAATQTENAANAGFSLAGGLFGLFDFRYTLGLTQDLNHHYRSRLFERIHALPLSAFDDERIGDAVYRVMYDTPSITELCYRALLTPVAGPVHVLMIVLVLQATFGAYPGIVWTALAFLPLAFLASLPFSGMLRRTVGRSRKAGATTTATVEEGMTNILAVQSLGAEARERGRFDRDSWESFGRHRAVLRVALASLLVGLLPGLGLAAYFFLYAADLVVAGRISIGDFTLLITYGIEIAAVAVDLGAVWIRVQGSAAGLHRVFFLMDLPAEQDAPGARALPRVREGLRIEHASFVYPDGTRALDDVSLEARVGAVTALVGPAGAGKTTLAHLVPRFVDPTSGRVLLDGVDVRDVTRESLRAQISLVFQETVLFDATVAENLRLANPHATDLEVRRAAQIAGADDFVRALPEGYATRLGRAGGKLSVGQKQRLAIARALLRPAPILILDEPTSALDPETESRLVGSLREASRERVVIVIAHRLSTVRAADQILFLDHGRVVERGSHAELMARPAGAYRRFVELQTRGAA
jgi:ABC-type multidrug transport system fused ATPase/permease subunit